MSAAAHGAPIRERQSDESVNARLLRARYGELAYCRLMELRAFSMGDERRVKFYREDAERARRCVDGLLKPRRLGVVVYPEIREEVRSWARAAEYKEVPW